MDGEPARQANRGLTDADHRPPAILDSVLFLPNVTPMPLQRRPDPFDGADWLFELKYDGFRALAYLQDGRCRFVSRNGHALGSFGELAEDIGKGILSDGTVLDGEIVCLDERGHPQFNDLLFRRRAPYYVAFDVLFDSHTDMRLASLVERKHALKRSIRGCSSSRLLYADHVEAHGVALFGRVCELDLEGIVAKHKCAPYVGDRDTSTWFKIRNPCYSQWAGRNELFERDRRREPIPGWHSCDLACASSD